MGLNGSSWVLLGGRSYSYHRCSEQEQEHVGHGRVRGYFKMAESFSRAKLWMGEQGVFDCESEAELGGVRMMWSVRAQTFRLLPSARPRPKPRDFPRPTVRVLITTSMPHAMMSMLLAGQEAVQKDLLFKRQPRGDLHRALFASR